MKRLRGGGFTLIEVMVALVVVGVALVAGLRAASALTGNAGRLSEMTLAQWCAENQLTGLRLARELPGIGDVDFACEQLGRPFGGRVEVRGTPNPNFRRVDAIVFDAGGQPLLRLSTVMSRY